MADPGDAFDLDWQVYEFRSRPRRGARAQRWIAAPDRKEEPRSRIGGMTFVDMDGLAASLGTHKPWSLSKFKSAAATGVHNKRQALKIDRRTSISWAEAEELGLVLYEQAFSRLKASALLVTEPDATIEALIRASSVRRVERYNTVYRKGSAGNCFFVALSGTVALVGAKGTSVEVNGDRPMATGAAPFASLSGGSSCFGTESCVLSMPRLGTAAVTSMDAILLSVPESAVGHDLRNRCKAHAITYLIHPLELFRGLSRATLIQVANLLDFRAVKSVRCVRLGPALCTCPHSPTTTVSPAQGEVIVKQGERATDFYVVAAGSFKATTAASESVQTSERTRVVGISADGMYTHFGEAGLLSATDGAHESRRMASVVADTDSWLLRLPPNAFEPFVSLIPDILDRFNRHCALLSRLNASSLQEERQAKMLRELQRERAVFGGDVVVKLLVDKLIHG